MIFPPLMGVAVSAVPAERAGMASGLTNACFPLGTAAGVAVFGALFSGRVEAGLEASLHAGPNPGPDGLVPARTAVETGRFELLEPALRPLARSAFSDGFTAVCLASALVCLLGVFAARTLRAEARTVGGGAAKRRRSSVAQTS